MKKILSLIYVVAVLFGMNLISVNAASKGKITITNSAVNTDVTYNAYRVLDLSYDETSGGHAYKVNENWIGFFDKENLELVTSYEGTDGVRYVTGIVGETDSEKEINAKTLAERALTYAQNNQIAATGSVEIKKGTKTGIIDNLDLGYYLVDSSLGALVHLDSTDTEAKVTEKNGEPTISKTVGKTTSSIGTELTYTIVVDVKAGAQNYKITDEMTKGLTLNERSFAFSYEGSTPTSNPTPSVENGANGTTFVIDYSNFDLSEVTRITITYTAVINKDAISVDEVNNKVTLDYGNGNKITDEDNNVKLYQFKIKKVSSAGDALTGAKFELYDAKTNGNKIELVKDGDSYRPKLAGENANTIEAGEATIKGLAKGTYYLQEVEAPVGYAIAGGRFEVVVDKDSTTVRPLDIENTKYAHLTPTGGMGTVLFVTIGSMMVFVFGLLLVTKFRMKKYN